VLNILQRNAGQVGALDIGYKPGVAALKGKTIKFLYLLGADEGLVGRNDVAKDAFIVYQGHNGDAGAEMADVILPGAAYTEKEGIWVNTEGRPQKGHPATVPPGDARSDWKIIRALSEVAQRTLEYDNMKELRQRMNQIAPHLLRAGDVEAAGYQDLAVQLAETGSSGAGDLSSMNLVPAQAELHEFWMTNSVTRASKTMAECVKAARQYEQNPHLDECNRQKHVAIA